MVCHAGRGLYAEVPMADRMVRIVLPGFLHNFTKTYRHDLKKISYMEASRHQLQSALKIRLYSNFLTK